MTSSPSALTPDSILAALAGEEDVSALAARWAAESDVDSVRKAIEAGADSLHRSAMRDVAGALRSAGRLVAMCDSMGDASTRLAARLALGIAQTYGNAFDAALATFDESESIEGTGPGATVLRARIGLARVHALARLGRLDDAAGAGERALRLLDEAGATDIAARAHANLGVIERMRQHPERAIERFRAALAAWGPDPVQRAQLTSNLAEAYLDLGRFAEAERSFRDALQSLEDAKATHAAAIVEGNLADLLGRQGRLGEALEHYERVRHRYLAIDARGDAARLQAEEADAFAQAGLLAESVAEYRAALDELDRCGLRLEALRARLGLARALGRLDRLDEAARVLESIGTIDQLPPASAGTLQTIRGEFALAIGDAAGAREHLSAAIPLLASRPTEEAVARTRLATACLELGDLALARASTERALDVARSHLLRPLEAELLYVAARCARAEGDEAAAMRSLRASVHAVESLRGTLQAARLRSAFVAGRASAAGDLVLSLVRAGDPASLREALRVSEQVRSRSLLDAIAGAVPIEEIAEGSDREAADLLRESAAIRHEANALFSRLDRQPGLATNDEWRSAVLSVESRQRLIESRLGAGHSVHAAIAAPPTDDDIARLIDAPAAHVVTFVAGGRLVGIVSRDGLLRGADLGAASEIADRIERFRFQIHRSLMSAGERARRIELDVAGSLRHIADAVLAPFEELLADAPAVQVIPAGPLHAVPFGVLPMCGDAMIAARPVATAPSLGVLLALNAQQSTAQRTAGRVVVGVADDAAPSIATEARAIAVLDGTIAVLIGQDATLERVRRAAQGASIFHCATHGRFVAESPLRSGVRLSDGWLTVTDLFRWRIPGTIVVVSGCDTGRVAVEGGDELTGLQRGFFAAGASAVVLSAWLAHDEATVELMCELHQRTGTCGSMTDTDARAGIGSGVVSAIREAALAVRQRRPRLVEWGAFGVYGSVSAGATP